MERARVPSDDAFQYVYGRAADDDRRLRAALLAAAIAHAGLLFVVFPETPKVAAQPETVHVIDPSKTYKLKQPEPTPPPPPEPAEPRRQARRIPMPAPPEAPVEVLPVEPIPIAVPATLEAVPISVPAVTIPEPPPAPAAEPIRVSGAEAPRRIHLVRPLYTEAARRIRLEGRVILDAIIAEDGTVQSVVALRSLGFGLTESAIEAVRQWRYEPPRINGRAVPVRMTVTVNFGLE